MATLIVLQGPDKGKTLKTADERVLIARGGDQLPLTDQTISRRHAELTFADGGWTLSDLNSANGTYVNGVRISKPTRLKHGDQIRLGSTLLVYAGDETIEQFAGRGIPTDLVTLDAGSESSNAAIVASVPANEDSVILAAPETANAVKAWNVMRELSSVIGSLLPSEQLLARVMDVIFAEVDVDRGVILMRHGESDDLLPEVVRFRRRRGQRESGRDAIIASRTMINHVVQSRAGVLCSNAIGDERFRSGKSVQNLGMRSVICAPIVARDQILGVIHLDCPVTRHTYSDYELRLITAIGYQTGLAIENARLVRLHMQQERLAAAGETVAYLSHYIKNILQGMRGGADVLQRGLDRRDFGIASQGWHIVERNLEKTYNLTLNMLAFSKQREPHLEMLQVNRIINEVVALVQKSADDAMIVLLADLSETLPPIPVDHDGIHQVVLNLLANAIDAVPGGQGIINVRTFYDAQARAVIISVTDNGPGVPPEQRDEIFRPFRSTKGQGGTGLGLAVARKIVREMNGTLEHVEPPDGGAEFRVRLPSVQPESETPEDTHGPPQ
ncbi:MAG: ATP-binding protein [Planctomycetota bacterium]